MSLKINQKAPDFTLPSTSGKDFTLSSDAAGKAMVLFFYPKDFTRGCSKEVCEFRDRFDFFKDLGILVYGISKDSINSHLLFKSHNKLPFDLLSDETGTVSKKYNVNIPFLNLTFRVTYLLDQNHNIIAVYDHFFENKAHIQKMIEALSTGV